MAASTRFAARSSRVSLYSIAAKLFSIVLAHNFFCRLVTYMCKEKFTALKQCRIDDFKKCFLKHIKHLRRQILRIVFLHKNIFILCAPKIHNAALQQSEYIQENNRCQHF